MLKASEILVFQKVHLTILNFQQIQGLKQWEAMHFIFVRSVKIIGGKCFYQSSIKNVEFESNSRVETIGHFAFSQCQELKHMTIPSNIRIIGRNCFGGSPIENFDILSNDNIILENGLLINKNWGLLLHPLYFIKSFEIPPNIKIIREWSFHKNFLENIEISRYSKLEFIGEHSFSGCKKLRCISIPSTVNIIGNYCFSESSIEHVEFENNSNIETFGEYTFSECKNLNQISIPSSVKRIEDKCFYNSSLQTLIFKNDSQIETFGFGAFEKCK